MNADKTTAETHRSDLALPSVSSVQSVDKPTADTQRTLSHPSHRWMTLRPKGFAVHPIPGRPIRAGMESDLPTLSTELVTLEGGGGQGIRVSWPTGWPRMILEYASELAQPTEWQAVVGVEGSQATVELPEEGQVFFRLRYVP